MLALKDAKVIKELARCLALPTLPKTILDTSRFALDLTFEQLIEDYRDILTQYGWLRLIDTMPIRKLPALKFELIHSPFIYIVKTLQRQNASSANTRTDYLVKCGNEVLDSLDAVIRRMGAREPYYRIFQIEEGKQRMDLFPSPGLDALLANRKDAEFRVGLDKAKTWIHKWKPEVVQEIDFLIRDYAMSRSLTHSFVSESVEYDPGHVKLYPRVLLKESGMLDYEGSDTEAVLIAAELIRESRRQKIFYFNRILDREARSMPNAFIKEGAKQKVLDGAFADDTLPFLFEMFLATGFEVMFLEYVIKSDPLDEYPSALEIRLEEKREHFRSITSTLSKHKDQLTDLGIASVKQLL